MAYAMCLMGQIMASVEMDIFQPLSLQLPQPLIVNGA